MNEALLSLSIAYIVVAILCLIAVIYSYLHWGVKSGLLMLMLVFYYVSYNGWKDSQGWPSLAQLPTKFVLHHAIVHEPDELTDSKGSIYIWVTKFHNFKMATKPRSYKMPYSDELHGKIQDALEEIKNGSLQVGQVQAEDEEEGTQNDNTQYASASQQVEFTALPDPTLPEK